MNESNQSSDINVLVPSAEANENTFKCSNAPPNYSTIMQIEDEEALSEKLEKQYGPFTFFDYVKTGIVLLVGSAMRLVVVIFLVCGPPSMIVMGSLYLYSCPVQPYIPIYLIVGGIFSLLSIIFVVVIRLKFRHKDEQSLKRQDLTLLGISNFIHCVTISWFIAGCTWVYGIYEPSYDNQYPYCDKVVYLFSFWLLNTIFISVGGLLLLGLFLLICSLIGRKNIGI